MELKYDQLNFEFSNAEKQFSWKMKFTVTLVAIFFTFTPLYVISPELFPTYKLVQVFFSSIGPGYL